jgi:hypothetical protein
LACVDEGLLLGNCGGPGTWKRRLLNLWQPGSREREREEERRGGEGGRRERERPGQDPSIPFKDMSQ